MCAVCLGGLGWGVCALRSPLWRVCARVCVRVCASRRTRIYNVSRQTVKGGYSWPKPRLRKPRLVVGDWWLVVGCCLFISLLCHLTLSFDVWNRDENLSVHLSLSPSHPPTHFLWVRQNKNWIQTESEALMEKVHESDYKGLERENILKDIDDLTDANEGLKQALDEAQMEVCVCVRARACVCVCV